MMRTNFEEFVIYMIEECGMPTTEGGAVICCECGDPIYEEDFNEDGKFCCPSCGYSIITEGCE